MDVRLPALAAAFLAVLTAPDPAAAASGCKLGALAELAVSMRGSQPMIAAKINGTDVHFLLDSGAFYSVISPASTAALNLPKKMAPAGVVVRGLGGDLQPMIATVRNFGLAGAIVNNMEFLVVGSDFGGDVVGILGQNILSFADMEYDLGGGVIRLIRADSCNDAARIYWVKPGEAFSTVRIDEVSAESPHLIGSAYLNGKKIRVMFDTGASNSVLTLRAAERAGVKTTSAGVVPGGFAHGLGTREQQTWIATFKSFKIGDEEIHDTRLRIADIDLQNADMLVGTDFFLSHRVYVALNINKLLFTYRGGPVFDLRPGRNAETIDAPGDAVADTRDPVDAQGFSRRGAVFAARHDLPHAIADMTRAIQMAPTDPEYPYQRARLYADSGRPALALNDLDQVINLKADHLDARVSRAELLLSRLQATGAGNTELIKSDIDAARSVASKEAAEHFDMGTVYADIGAQDEALAEFELWLESHREDTRAPDARAFTCRARAVLGRELESALSDCNGAVRDRPGMPFPLEARGLVQLRLRNFDKAIADFDKVLAQQPHNVWALYGRGLAKLGSGATAAGQTDIAAARATNAKVVSNAAARGFVP